MYENEPRTFFLKKKSEKRVPISLLALGARNPGYATDDDITMSRYGMNGVCMIE